MRNLGKPLDKIKKGVKVPKNIREPNLTTIVLISGMINHEIRHKTPYGCTNRWYECTTIVWTDSQKWLRLHIKGYVCQLDISKLHSIRGVLFLNYYGKMIRVVPPANPHGVWLREI